MKDLRELAQLRRRVAELENRVQETPTRWTEAVLNVPLEKVASLVMQHSSDLISVHNAVGDYLFVNPNCAQQFGWEPEELLGTSAYTYFHPEDLDRISANHEQHFDTGDAATLVEYRFRCKDGSYRWVQTRSQNTFDNKGAETIVAVTRDVHDQRLALVRAWEAEERKREMLAQLAFTDTLTGLRNRRAMEETLRAEHARWSRNGGNYALIFLDLDHFKQINDTHGHLCGDQALVRTAKTLKKHVRVYDTVARWGGEEFLVLVPSIPPRDAFGLAERLRIAISELEIPGNEQVQLTVSAGVSWVSDEDQFLDVVSRADRALYRAKTSGRDQCMVLSPEMERPMLRLVEG